MEVFHLEKTLYLKTILHLKIQQKKIKQLNQSVPTLRTITKIMQIFLKQIWKQL